MGGGAGRFLVFERRRDSHGGLPGAVAHLEGAVRLEAGLRGQAGRCVGLGRVDPGARIEETSRGTFSLKVPGWRRKRGANMTERQSVLWVLKIFHKG